MADKYMKVNPKYLRRVVEEVGSKYGKDAHYLSFLEHSGDALVPLAGYKGSEVGGDGGGNNSDLEMGLPGSYLRIGGLYGSRKAADWEKLNQEEKDRLVKEAIDIL